MRRGRRWCGGETEETGRSSRVRGRWSVVDKGELVGCRRKKMGRGSRIEYRREKMGGGHGSERKG